MDELFSLVKAQQWEKFMDLIKTSTVDLNIKDANKNYLIQYIILYNNLKVLKEFLYHSGKTIYIDWLDTSGRSILYTPIKYGHMDIVKELIEYDKKLIGVSVHMIKDMFGHYPLHYAVKFGNIAAYKILIEMVPIDIMDNDENSIIHLAIKDGNEVIYKDWVERGGNINARNVSGETGLYIATMEENMDAVKYLLKNDKINVNITTIEHTLTALNTAIDGKNCELIELLLSAKNINVNIPDIMGYTPLHNAIRVNNFKIVALILKHKSSEINFNILDRMGNTPLHYIMNDCIIINNIDVKIFIKNTALNIQNSDGDTIIHKMFERGVFLDYKELLKEKVVDLFIKNIKGIAPFDMIIDEQKDEVIEVVVNGYYVNLPGKEWANKWENDCGKGEMSRDKCLGIIKKKIISGQNSIPVKKLGSCVILKDYENADMTTFMGNIITELCGYIQLSNEHSNILTTATNSFNDNISIAQQFSVLGLMKHYEYSLGVDYYNFHIHWIMDKLIYPSVFNEVINDFRNNENKTLLACPLSLPLIGSGNGHAGVVIVDKNWKTIERFEPHGKNHPNIFDYKPLLLDKMLEFTFKKHFGDYNYLSPRDTQQEVGFQKIEETVNESQYIGDPNGFCVAWCLWYVMQRSTNMHIHPCKLARKLTAKLKEKGKPFREVIRAFSAHIIKLRNKVLDSVGITFNKYLNAEITQEQRDNLVKSIKLELL